MYKCRKLKGSFVREIMANRLNKILDKFGVCASTVCLIHCLATPFVIMFFPGIKGVFTEEAHEVFAIIVVTLIALAVYPLCKKSHGHRDILALAFTGVVLILSAIFFEELMPIAAHYGLTTIGSICLIAAHIKNIRVRHGNCSNKI